MRKTLIAMTAASALALGFSSAAFAGNGNGNHSHNDNGNNSHNLSGGSSLLNIGGQRNGAGSVSGVFNDQNVSTGGVGIYNNASPVIEFGGGGGG